LPLREGITTYFLPRFNLEAFAFAIHAFSITETAVVPPIITALLKLDPTQNSPLRSLRYIACAGAPMNAEVQARLYSRLSSNAIIAQCWGMTEIGLASTFRFDEKDMSGSVGRLLPNMELKIVDENGQIVRKEGGRGEAYLRSPGLFNGYRNDPEANSTAFDPDLFYRTGDRVFVTNGKIFIDGRVKDIMKVNGWQVSPSELENILLEYPGIIDAAVSGIVRSGADGIEEVLPKAFVVCRRLSSKESVRSVTADELTSFMASKVVSYKRLTGGVEFVDRIPRSSVGKILRRQL